MASRTRLKSIDREFLDSQQATKPAFPSEVNRILNTLHTVEDKD